MNISNAIQAKSSQLNAVDLMGGPQTVSVVDVTEGGSEQPVNIITDTFGPGRPFKPSKTVLRMLGGAWGMDTAAWIGHRMSIYREPTVVWAGEEIGGIRILALSHIDKPITFNLPTSKTKHAKSVVSVLPADTTPTPPTIDPTVIAEWVAHFAATTTLPQLQASWVDAGKQGVAGHPDVVAAKDAKKAELQGVSE